MAFAPKPAAKAKAKPADEVERPDVELHDEVYFRHEAGPKCGRVVAHGKHGATVHADGQHHKVKWEHILGHKMKVQPQVRVIDQGADGMIVEDAAGRRRYVHDPIGDGPPPMTKSLLPRILFFDAGGELAKAMGGIKNRPGLSQKDVTDKNGRTSKHWVRTNKDQPKARRGGKGGSGGGKGGGGGDEPPHDDAGAGGAPEPRKEGEKVSFQLGSLRGHGQIVGEPGKDGATVEDASGHRHKVLYSQMTSQEAMAGTGIDKPPAEKPAGHDAGHHEGSAFMSMPPAAVDALAREVAARVEAAKMGELFAGAASDSLPAKVSSKFTSWEQIDAASADAQAALQSMLDGVGKAVGAKEATIGPDGFYPKDLEGPGAVYGLGPIKTAESAARKVNSKYGGDWSKLGDVVRASIGFDSVEELKAGIERLQKAGLKLATKPDNKFVKPTDAGYRDINLNIEMPNGIVGELQLHLKPILKAKNEGHKDYEMSRLLDAKAKNEPPLSPNDQRELEDRLLRQRILYTRAMQSALPTTK